MLLFPLSGSPTASSNWVGEPDYSSPHSVVSYFWPQFLPCLPILTPFQPNIIERLTRDDDALKPGLVKVSFLFSQLVSSSSVWFVTSSLGKDGVSKTDEFSEKFQTAFDPPPHFRKIILRFSRQNCDKSAYVQYGGTVVYYMILFPMRCMQYNSSTWYCH